MATAIKAENISKAYQLGQIGTGTLGNDLKRWYANVRGKEDPFLKIGETNDRTVKGASNVVWSLKDISFEIEQGDAVGIIGRNGAGKSTLLKILSRVTAPTTGKISGNGRVASLLEVGTGFHPELSGKDNIYLNGAILGMRKKEIKRKFDEIVDFAGVERYIDTPVKRYSSGMYVRLAFAVAAYLESEILIVDEVLAVGDAEFQKKCLGKMNEVSKGEGRTVLFVSHNMASINQLCDNAILLKNGVIDSLGKTSAVLSKYFYTNSDFKAHVILTEKQRTGNGYSRFNWIKIYCNNTDIPNREISIGDDLVLVFNIESKIEKCILRMSIELKSSDGLKMANMIDVDSNFLNISDKLKTYEVRLKDIRLYPGTYFLSLYVGDQTSTEVYDYVEDCISFEVIDGGSLTKRPLPKTAGLFFFTPKWKVLKDYVID